MPSSVRFGQVLFGASVRWHSRSLHRFPMNVRNPMNLPAERALSDARGFDEDLASSSCFCGFDVVHPAPGADAGRTLQRCSAGPQVDRNGSILPEYLEWDRTGALNLKPGPPRAALFRRIGWHTNP
jgi:hypothetical protein